MLSMVLDLVIENKQTSLHFDSKQTHKQSATRISQAEGKGGTVDAGQRGRVVRRERGGAPLT